MPTDARADECAVVEAGGVSGVEGAAGGRSEPVKRRLSFSEFRVLLSATNVLYVHGEPDAAEAVIAALKRIVSARRNTSGGSR